LITIQTASTYDVAERTTGLEHLRTRIHHQSLSNINSEVLFFMSYALLSYNKGKLMCVYAMCPGPSTTTFETLT